MFVSYGYSLADLALHWHKPTMLLVKGIRNHRSYQLRSVDLALELICPLRHVNLKTWWLAKCRALVDSLKRSEKAMIFLSGEL